MILIRRATPGYRGLLLRSSASTGWCCLRPYVRDGLRSEAA
jgi:hypothetical protein